jgi:hypothetical protein
VKQAKIVALILFIILIAAGVAEQFYIKRIFITFGEYTAALERTVNASDLDGEPRKISENDLKSAIKTLNEFDEWWRKESKLIESLSHNRDIKNAAQEISKLEGLLEIQNVSEAQISLVALKSTAKNLEQALTFRFEHII